MHIYLHASVQIHRVLLQSGGQNVIRSFPVSIHCRYYSYGFSQRITLFIESVFIRFLVLFHVRCLPGLSSNAHSIASENAHSGVGANGILVRLSFFFFFLAQ